MRKFSRRSLLTLIVIAGTAAFALVSDALQRGQQSMIDRRYAEAAEQLTAALNEVSAAQKPYVLLLIGRAQWLGGDHQAAVGTYRQLVADHPDSALADKAELQAAEALAAARRHQEAADLYRRQIERLTGPERKEEIAATYLGLADRALGTTPPDYGRAVTFYDLALDLGLSPAKARSIRLLTAEALLRAQRIPEAIQRFDPLVEELDQQSGKLRSMLGLGRARAAAGDAAGARAVLRDLVALAPETAEAADASWEIARTFGVPRPPSGQLERAITALRELAERYPAHQQARVADFLIAQCLLGNERTADALESLRTFVAAHGDERIGEVAEARARIGDVLFLQGKLEDAIAAWQEYLQAHPAHSEWERVQRSIVDAEYARAAIAAEEERWQDARDLYEAFASRHPLDERNPQVLRDIGETLAAEQKWEQAREAFARCVSKYPGRPEASHAQFRIGEIHETAEFDYDKALEAYRAVQWGPWQQQARARIARLERKSLHLRTERSFRSGEPAEFHLVSRNMPSVRIRVYRLDLETWFRATHVPGQVERLDIEVIEPDETFESEVPEYVPHQETDRTVPVRFTEPGAYVVKVDDSELEATTMVLVTDLGIIAKSSRHEFFVFTQNLKEDRVEGGVRVILSDGQKIVAEGRTDDTGVWSYRGDALRESDQLRAFVVDACGSAAGTLDLSGLGYSQGLAAKSYVFTDRPAYSPGQLVHVKGIVREVSEGGYVLPEQGAKYRARITSSSGRVLLDQAVSFTDFGTFAVDLPLPGEAELGTWRALVARDGSGETFTAEFEVARFDLPRLAITAETDEPVVFRGESIHGRFHVRHFYGEPAIGRKVSYSMQLPDGSVVQRQGETNAAGEVEFTLDTQDFAEEGLAIVVATVAEANARALLTVPVVTREFEAKVTTLRPVFLAGEPFDVRVTIEDRSGKPLARPGTLRLFRLEQSKRGTGEIEVDRKELRTTADTGAATVSLRAANGGEYALRFEASDRFGNLVTAEQRIAISGEDDAIKLRLLTDRQHYQVGDTIKVKVVNRAAERLALRTFQGDGVIEHAAIRLPSGESEFEIPLDASHAPNFALALAMIDGRELRTAQREFEVERDLQVVCTPAREITSPGEPLEVTVEARDRAGRPVAAELALALVNESLFALFADRSPDIGGFFWGQRRGTDLRTTSSCAWSYEGSSRPVSEALVAEERRLAEATRIAEEPVLQDSDEGASGDPHRTANVVPDAARTGGEVDRIAGYLGDLQVRRFSDREDEDIRELLKSQLQSGQTATAAEDFYMGAGRLGRFAQDSQQGLFAGTGVEIYTMEGVGEALALPTISDQPRRVFDRQGGWLSSVVTDADTGRATISLPMPDSDGEWRMTARAVTVSTDVGLASSQVRTARELVATITAPSVLTEGDVIDVRTQLHNRSATARTLSVSWCGQAPESLALAAGEERLAEHAVVAEGSDPLDLALTVDGTTGDAVTVLVAPFGLEHRDGRAGLVNQAARWSLSLPTGRDYEHLELRVEVGPDPGRDLVAAALGLGFRPGNCRFMDPTNLAVASRGLGAAAVRDYLGGIGGGEQVDVARLDAVIAAAVQQLVAAQAQDGSFAWIGRGTADLRTTAQAVRFLSRARAHGVREAAEPMARAAGFLQQQVRQAPTQDRVVAALALAEARQVGFEVLNALHRQRAQLELDALGRLALAWRAATRAELAAEVDQTAADKLILTESADPSSIEAIALATTSRLAGDPRDLLATRALDWLRGQRRGATWGTPAATAAALQALTAAGGALRSAADVARIQVRVNGESLGGMTRDVIGANLELRVPAGSVRAQDNVVEVTVEGQGQVHCSAVLSGFARGITDADRRDELVRVNRRYMPALLRHDGKPVRPGFAVVEGQHSSFENRMTELSVGATGRVETFFYVRGEGDRPYFTPLIVEEPIPAGCIVPRDSIQGSFDHVEVLQDRLVLYYREGLRGDNFSYELTGRFKGQYRVLPTMVYGAARPDLVAYGAAGELQILARGAATSDTYRMSPDELYELGRARYDAGDLLAAGELLDELTASWKLRQDVAREVSRMMLFIAIERGRAADVVRWFEDLKDRYPDLVIPFDKILAVGQAYIDLGEFEAAVLVFRATAEASFLKEAAVATTLEQLGEVRASVRFLRRLLDTYPDLNTMRQSLYGIGQKLGLIAERIADGAPVDDKVGSRRDLQQMAVEAFRDFLVMYPEDPLAEEVSFSWATTLIEMRELEQARAIAEGALQRYPDSTLEDEFLYTVGFARFVGGLPQEALEVLQRVAKEDFARPGGGRGPSENQEHAIYLEGQIFHSLDEPGRALELYDRVTDKFSDAGEAAEYFRRRMLQLPEVVRFGPGEAAKVQVGHRNLDEVTLKVYRVDLMRLYLLHKSLNDIRDIQLHGIHPHWESTIDLRGAARYVDHDQAFELPIDELGAYLVVARSGDLIASGMALRSDLEIEAQESLDVGRVRVNVKRAGAFVAGAHVKVVGSSDGRLRAGDTDPRGVFIADDVVGRATVIARIGDAYAFFRGEGVHQPQRVPPPSPPPQRPQQQVEQQAERKDFDAWENNFRVNDTNRARQTQWLEQEVLQKQQKGVEVYRAK